MADGLTKMALGIFGFGFCKASLGAAYMTAMGSVFSTVGFVSELNFMVPMLVSSLLTASALVLMVRSRRLLSGALRQYPAVISLSRPGFFSAPAICFLGPPMALLPLSVVRCVATRRPSSMLFGSTSSPPRKILLHRRCKLSVPLSSNA